MIVLASNYLNDNPVEWLSIIQNLPLNFIRERFWASKLMQNTRHT